MMYTKLESAKIFSACSTTDEVIQVGKAFGYLNINTEDKVPSYVVEQANLRYRKLGNIK